MEKAIYLKIFSIAFIILLIIPGAIAIVISKGDSVVKADQVRSIYGVDGYGVKVGVISDGVDSLPLIQQMGELPSDVTVLSNQNDGDEGTMMLQIIHDIAPGAQLYFHDSGTSPKDFNLAIDALLAAGCQIICDDISFTNDPVYEDGVSAAHIQKLIHGNRPFIEVSAAGNYALQHYRAQYYKGEDNYHDFSLGKSNLTDIYLDIPYLQKITAILKWDEKADTSKDDYDLFLVRASDGEILKSSQIRQNGTGMPFEYLRWINMGQNTERVAVRIQNHEGKAAQRDLDLLLVVPTDVTILPYNLITDHSVFGHTGAPGVISVAAVSADNTNTIEPYSSAGTVDILFPKKDKRKKPDITGPDNVEVIGSSGKVVSFSGTSAAAPHIAGVLALLWSAFPGTDAADIRESIIRTATDLGSPGWDERYGYGLVDAMKAIKSLGTIETSKSHAERVGWTPETIVMKNGTIKGEYYPDGNFKVTGPGLIDRPGNYRLARDILQSGRRFTISINCSDVTLDGDGHTISGVIFGEARPKTQAGLNINGMYRVIRNITIKNLQLKDFDWGIFLGLSKEVWLENCSLTSNFGGLFSIKGENLTIRKSTITGNEYGIYEFGGKNPVLISNTFKDNTEGLTMYNPQTGEVINNNFITNTKHGLFIFDSGPIDFTNNSFLGNYLFGLSLVNVSGMNVADNIFVDNFNAVSIVNSNKPVIRGNLIKENTGIGVGIIDSENILLKNNTLGDNNYGVSIYGGKNISVLMGSIIGNKRAGIVANVSENITVKENTISSSKTGIIFANSSWNSVISNEIMKNSIGVLLQNSSENRLDNNILVNEKDIMMIPENSINYLNGTRYRA